MNEKNIAARQVWKYKCQAGEEKFRVTKFKLDDVSESSIVHIRIDGQS